MPQTNIAQLAGLSDAELNERAAKCLGWKWDESRCRVCGFGLSDNPCGCQPGNCSMRPRPAIDADKQFAPYCTSHDACHCDLIPEIERRGLWSQFTAALISARCYTEPGIVRHALIRTPRQITIAFIATCEAEPAPSEPEPVRVLNGVPNRMDRLAALGNAVVPQVAEWIGRRIMEAAA